MKMKLLCAVVATLLTASAYAQISITTTIRPLQLIALAVVQDRATVNALVDGRQSPHAYNMSPSDRIAIAQADLLMWIDPGFEVYLSDIFPQQGKSKVLITTTELQGLNQLKLSAQQVDPHLWLDTHNAVRIAEAVKNEMIELDAESAAFYRRNFEQFSSNIEALNRAIADKFLRADKKSFGVYHNAYQYFENQFGLSRQITLVQDPELQPSFQDIVDVRAQIRAALPQCLFIEADSNQAIIDTMLAGHELRKVTIDLLGYQVASDASGYEKLITNVAREFESCLSAR